MDRVLQACSCCFIRFLIPGSLLSALVISGSIHCCSCLLFPFFFSFLVIFFVVWISFIRVYLDD